MSVQNILLDFSMDPARLGDESGQKTVFSQLETVLKEYVPNLILAADIKVDGGSMKLLTGKRGTTVSVRLFDQGLVTVNIEYYKEDTEEPLINFKSVKVLENQLRKHITVIKSQAFPTIKRCLFGRYFPTSDERLLEYDIDGVLFDEQSSFQKVQIIHSKSFGNMLVLDDLQRYRSKVGDSVIVPIPDVDKGKADLRNILGVVLEVISDQLYKIGTRDGILDKLYCRSEFDGCIEKFICLEEVPNVVITLRTAARKSATGTGQGFTRCVCSLLLLQPLAPLQEKRISVQFKVS